MSVTNTVPRMSRCRENPKDALTDPAACAENRRAENRVSAARPYISSSVSAADHFSVFRKAIRFLRSVSSLIPTNTILLPGMAAFGSVM